MTLSVTNLTVFNKQETLIAPVSFTVNPGEIVTLMGPSGCGKSTLLSAIAGHLAATFTLQGDVQMDNSSVLNLPPDQRHIGLLFQDDLLFPHLDVLENLMFGLPRRYGKSERVAIAQQTLEQINLAMLAHHMPNEISGGQRARISLMRMLLSEPRAVLLDEPFSKLDKELRHEFRSWVFDQIKQRQIPAIMVTHDHDDIPADGIVMHWPWTNTSQENHLC